MPVRTVTRRRQKQVSVDPFLHQGGEHANGKTQLQSHKPEKVYRRRRGGGGRYLEVMLAVTPERERMCSN